MENLINGIITEFQEKQQHITATNPDELLKASKGIKLCQATLSKLKKIIIPYSFEDMASEIHFFKQVKHLPMSYLLYYKKVCSCETHIPKIGYKAKRKYLEQKMKMINTFFSVNTTFVNYIRLQCSNLDTCYFTRNFIDNDSSIETNDIYYVPEFNTMRDILLAKVKANYMYMEYLNRKIGKLHDTEIDFPIKGKFKKRLVFVGKKVHLVKLILALKAAKVFKGNPSLSIIKEIFEETFSTKIHNIYKTRGEIKATEHPADFLEDLVYWFNKSLEDEDDMDS